MNHYVYETINLINGKKYIGKRSCRCSIEDDKYIGSGNALKFAIKKYGKENFKKVMLIICNTEDEAFAWEDFLTLQVNAWVNPLYYNLRRGGKGGSTNISEETRKRLSDSNKGKKMPEYQKEIISKTLKKRWQNESFRIRFREKMSGENNPMYGKHLSIETRNKISKTRKDKYFGENHPMYGKHHTENSKEKVSIANKGKTAWNKGKKGIYTEEVRNKMSESHKGENGSLARKVLLVNTGEVFNYIKLAAEKYNANCGHVTNCCKGKRKSAGKHPITGEKLTWKYLEDSE